MKRYPRHYCSCDYCLFDRLSEVQLLGDAFDAALDSCCCCLHDAGDVDHVGGTGCFYIITTQSS
jgi:hypothetical protein